MRRPGIVAPPGDPGDVNLMLGWRPGAVSCQYPYLRANKIFEYKAANPGVSVIVRFPHPQNWFQDPETSAVQFGQMIAGKWNELAPLAPTVIFANELNTWRANGDSDPKNQPLYQTEQFYERAGQWISRTAQVIKQLAPAMKLAAPPFSPGRGEDGNPDDAGNISASFAGYDYLAQAIQTYFDNTLAFHAFWGDIKGADPSRLYHPQISAQYAFRWRRALAMCQKRYNIQAKIIIPRAGNFAAYDTDFFEQITYFSQQSLSDPRVLALTCYLWEDPAFDPIDIFNVWTQYILDLPAFTQKLAAQPDVVISETPSFPQIPPPAHSPFADSQIRKFDGIPIRVMFDDGHVENMPLESYLRGVVPGEMPASWPSEALKTQAVAARTYALRYILDARSAKRAYDVSANPNIHQNYRRDRIHPRSDAAILATKGLVLTADGQRPIYAFFSDNCGGHTFNNEDVFKAKDGSPGKPVSYLRGAPCPAPGPKRGHGVGMCQNGARVLAEQGLTFERILRHYYTGAALKRLQLPATDTPGAVTEGSPKPTDWKLRIERFPGYSVINGNLADKPDLQITVTRPDGFVQTTRSGSKPEFGAGGFEATVTNPGVYTLKFLDQQFTVQMDGKTTARLHFSTGDQATAPPAQSAIGGALKDQFGKPIVGRSVRLDSPAGAQTALTGAEGRFIFENLPAGTWQLSVPDSTLSRTITLDGRESKIADLTLRVAASSGDWHVEVQPRPGNIPLMVGDIGTPQIPITVTAPSGAQSVVISGGADRSRLEFERRF
ncbi:MAG: hypothetical protein B6243_06690 [Anaerolineaceae bacterium 4572_5.2]|nr:MAG: hypothetical protein B6243_06690 [Anaerolineaceae bacterium 4572_5.2]